MRMNNSGPTLAYAVLMFWKGLFRLLTVAVFFFITYLLVSNLEDIEYPKRFLEYVQVVGLLAVSTISFMAGLGVLREGYKD
jgi:uncharacterized membrane protein